MESKQPTPLAPLLVRERDLPELLGLSRATCRRLMARGAFPAALRIGRCVAWKRGDLERWVDGGCAAAEGGTDAA